MDSVRPTREQLEHDVADLHRQLAELTARQNVPAQPTDELRASRVQFRDLVESSSDWVWEVDRDGRYTYVSPRVRDVLGREPDDLIGTTPFDIMPPAEADRVAAIFQDIVNRAEPFSRLENVCLHADGREVVTETVGMPVHGPDGALIGYRGVDRDITERKRTEQALRGSEEKFRSLSESAPVGIWHTDSAGRVLYTNKRWREITGLTLAESLGPGWSNALHPDDLERIIEEWSRCVSEEKGWSGEFRFISTSGEVRWVLTNTAPIRSETGQVIGHVGSNEDITERKRAEEALARRAEFERLVSEVSSDFVRSGPSETDAGIDRALAAIGAFTEADRAYVFLFKDGAVRMDNTHEWCAEGVEPQVESLKDIPLGEELPWFAERIRTREVVHVPDVAALPSEARLEREHFESQGIQSLIVVPMALGDRHIGFLGFDAVRSRRSWTDDDQALLRLVGEIFIHSIERKRAEAERGRLEEQLRQAQKMEAVGQLAGGIAHDFNNILTIVKGNAELLKMGLPSTGDQAEFADEVIKGANRAADLIRQLLAFARKGKWQVVPVDIHNTIAQTVNMLAHSIDRRIDIRMELHASPSTVMGDPTQLQNALLNLGVNARDAMADGGVLTYATRNVTLAEADSNEHPYELTSGNFLEICVTDTGVGMDEQTQERVFEPFFTTKEVGKGTGLGLAGVYGCVKSHDGSISVASEPGRGATFAILLPLAPAGVATEGRTAPRDDLVRGTGHVLVLDDERGVRNFARAVLQDLGYTVWTCADGAEGLDYYRRHYQEIDLVILDLIMPRMNGRDVFSQMKKINPHVRALISSGFSHSEATRRMLDAGALALLNKPFEVTELSRAVAEHIQGDRPQ